MIGDQEVPQLSLPPGHLGKAESRTPCTRVSVVQAYAASGRPRWQVIEIAGDRAGRRLFQTSPVANVTGPRTANTLGKDITGTLSVQGSWWFACCAMFYSACSGHCSSAISRDIIRTSVLQ